MRRLSTAGYASLAAAALWLLVAIGFSVTTAGDANGRTDRTGGANSRDRAER